MATDSIVNPVPNNWTSPLQENMSGVVGGVGFVIIGIGIIIAKIFYGW